MMTTLGEELPRETARVRELLVQYEKIGPAGAFAAALMRQALAEADRAMIEQDAPAMMGILYRLKGFE